MLDVHYPNRADCQKTCSPAVLAARILAIYLMHLNAKTIRRENFTATLLEILGRLYF